MHARPGVVYLSYTLKGFVTLHSLLGHCNSIFYPLRVTPPAHQMVARSTNHFAQLQIILPAVQIFLASGRMILLSENKKKNTRGWLNTDAHLESLVLRFIWFPENDVRPQLIQRSGIGSPG